MVNDLGSMSTIDSILLLAALVSFGQALRSSSGVGSILQTLVIFPSDNSDSFHHGRTESDKPRHAVCFRFISIKGLAKKVKG